jgi:hypothetical protein
MRLGSYLPTSNSLTDAGSCCTEHTRYLKLQLRAGDHVIRQQDISPNLPRVGIAQESVYPMRLAVDTTVQA